MGLINLLLFYHKTFGNLFAQKCILYLISQVGFNITTNELVMVNLFLNVSNSITLLKSQGMIFLTKSN